MILHIVKDDKFISTITKIFEAATPKKNIYAVWRESSVKIPSLFHSYKIDKSNQLYSIFPKRSADVQKSKYSNPDTSIAVSEYGTKEFFTQIGDLSKYKLIIFHSLVYNHAKLVHIINKHFNIPIIWSPFGYEVYNMLAEFRGELFQPKTKKYIENHKSRSEQLFNLLTPLKAKAIKGGIRKIDHCAISVDTELDVYKNKINPNLQQHWFTYYPLDLLIKDKTLINDAPNILLGNSAFPSNNHLEAFDLLKKFSFHNREIITPLSYGIPKYAEAIAKKGEELFGESFVPLKIFMSLDKYNQIISKCGIVIMNQNRQQAFGNILSSVWFGAKVFLHPDNTIYTYLKSLSIHVFSIVELEDINDKTLQRLKPEEAAHNRKILSNEYSFNNIVTKTQEMIHKFC